MPDPLVSVVVPIFNTELYLERCLDSIIAQHYRPIEVILVNDGSQDNCGEIIRRYEARYPFVQSIWQENLGVGPARNAGIANASGKYLSLVDSDDYIDPEFISNLVAIAEKAHADVAMCSFYLELPFGIKFPFPLIKLKEEIPGEVAAKFALQLMRFPAFAWVKLYRRDFFKTHGIQYPPFYYEDVAIASKIMIHAGTVVITNKALYHYCLRSTGITGNFGIRNVMDYLKAADMVRHFIWDEQLWDAWGKSYLGFLRVIEAQLFLEITLQKNSIPIKNRGHLIRQIHHRMRELSKAPW